MELGVWGPNPCWASWWSGVSWRDCEGQRTKGLGGAGGEVADTVRDPDPDPGRRGRGLRRGAEPAEGSFVQKKAWETGLGDWAVWGDG